MKQKDRVKVTRPTGRALHNLLAIPKKCNVKDCEKDAVVVQCVDGAAKINRCVAHVNFVPSRLRPNPERDKILKSLGMI
jgi:hypothetical protein